MRGFNCFMELIIIRDFVMVRIRKGFIKEMSFEVDFEGLGGFGLFRVSWEMKELGVVGGIVFRLGSWLVGI